MEKKKGYKRCIGKTIARGEIGGMWGRLEQQRNVEEGKKKRGPPRY